VEHFNTNNKTTTKTTKQQKKELNSQTMRLENV
jgi:hypothetical protein